MTIGLFGTCGNSTWRTPFIEKYTTEGISFYNPQVPNWTPECAAEEAEHLLYDDILLFPVTAETYASGSLAETGFSILSAIRANTDRYVIVFIDPKVDQALADENPVAAKESVRSRALVLAHLKKLNHPNVFQVKSLEDMLALSLVLRQTISVLSEARRQYT